MSHDKAPYVLLVMEHDEIRDVIFEENLSRCTPQEIPRAFVTGGQPGAGKSLLAEIAKNELRGVGGYLVIDADRYRNKHPQYGYLQQTEPTQAAIDAALASLGVGAGIEGPRLDRAGAVMARDAEAAALTPATSFDHVFTHFRMRAHVHRLDLADAVRGASAIAGEPSGAGAWVALALDAEAIAAAPLATPVRALLLAAARRASRA